MAPNSAVLLRDAFNALNDYVVAQIRAAGHEHVRAAHGNVFQHLDDDGTTVSVLAERARMTKQAMAELVAHLEQHGYVTRVPDPADGRAKLVQVTERGREVFAIAREGVAWMDALLDELLGPARVRALRADLEAIAAQAQAR